MPNPALTFTGRAHLEFWLKRLPPSDRKFTYVILRGSWGGPIKIGKAKNPLGRLKTFQTACDEQLYLLYVIPGYTEMEKALQQKLKGWRKRGEWFSGSQVEHFLVWLEDYCEEQKHRYFQTGDLPEVPGAKAPTGDVIVIPDNPDYQPKAKRELPMEVRQKLQAAAKAGFKDYELRRYEDELLVAYYRDAA